MIKVYPVILAAGKGTRMNNGNPSPIPKVLFALGGKPIVSYILNTLSHLSFGIRSSSLEKSLVIGHSAQKLKTKDQTNIDQLQTKNQGPNGLRVSKPLLVVGYKAAEVKKEFGSRVSYVEQTKRLGTGHAAKLAIEKVNIGYEKLTTVNNSYDMLQKNATVINRLQPLLTDVNLILIMMGDDSAFYEAETLKTFIENHIKEKAVLSFLTTKIPGVQDLGRVIRNKSGNLIDIVEKENLTEKQKKIDEINCACYLAELSWLAKTIKQVKKHLKGGKEYPLPDIIKIALKNGEKVIAYEIPNGEFVGINSRDQLEYAESKLKVKRQK